MADPTDNPDPMPTDEELLRRAVQTVCGYSSQHRRKLKWCAVMYTFGTGRSLSERICRRFGANPDDEVGS